MRSEASNEDELSGKVELNEEYLYRRLYAGKFLSELDELNNLKHTPGETYLCVLPDGHYKIGYSTELPRRMERLGAHLVVALDGGETLELIAHYQLAEYRLSVRGEKFIPATAVLDWFRDRVKPGRMAGSSKTCKTCNAIKRMLDFGTLKTAKDGHYSSCLSCRKKLRGKG